MKYLCLVYLDAEHWNACSDNVCADYAQQVAGSGRLLAGQLFRQIEGLRAQ